MFDGEGDPDYKGSLEELEQNLLLQQLDEIIEAFESKEGVGKGGNNEKRTTWNFQSFHKTNRVDGAQTRQKSRLVLLMYKSKRLHKNMKGLWK